MSNGRSILSSASFWIYAIIAIASFYLSWQISFSLSVDNYIPKDSSSNILKALLDAEIALVGFWAIILVYVFNNLREAKGSVSRSKHELEVKIDTQVITDKELQPLWERYKTRIVELDMEFRQLVVQTFITAITAVVTVILLFLSIFQNIYSIGSITNRGLHYSYLFQCLLPLFMAFMLIFTATIFSLPRREMDILKQEIRKQWEKAKG